MYLCLWLCSLWPWPHGSQTINYQISSRNLLRKVPTDWSPVWVRGEELRSSREWSERVIRAKLRGVGRECRGRSERREITQVSLFLLPSTAAVQVPLLDSAVCLPDTILSWITSNLVIGDLFQSCPLGLSPQWVPCWSPFLLCNSPPGVSGKLHCLCSASDLHLFCWQ